jgi:hypothetical protein
MHEEFQCCFYEEISILCEFSNDLENFHVILDVSRNAQMFTALMSPEFI